MGVYAHRAGPDLSRPPAGVLRGFQAGSREGPAHDLRSLPSYTRAPSAL